MRKSHLHDLLNAGPGFVCSTGSTGANQGTGLPTVTPFCLFNPPTSNRRVYLVHASYGYVSGGPGTGTPWLCYNDTPGQAAPTGTSMAIKPARMMSSESSLMQCFKDATLPNNQNVYIPLGPQDPTGGGFRMTVYYCDGFQQVDPGGILSFTFVGSAGAAPILNYGFLWVEVTI